MPVPLVNVFSEPYEAWTTRMPTLDEVIEIQSSTGFFPTHIKDKLIARVKTPLEAAIHIAKVGADGGLGNFINGKLDNSEEYRFWRRAMPTKTPQSLSDYQRKFPNCDFDAVNNEINLNGITLPDGQILFHGGSWGSTWDNITKFVTNKPLSTTFCPQVALRNAEHNGKAYEANMIDIFVLKAHNSSSRAFVYRRKGTDQGHENEVLFASGLKMHLRSRQLISDSYGIMKWPNLRKEIPIYVSEVDIS